MLDKKHRWIIPAIGIVWLMASPILAIWTWFGALLAFSIGLTILHAVSDEIVKEKEAEPELKNNEDV